VALLIAVLTLLARPFLMLDHAQRAFISERHQLETEKEALLLQIQQLDFDHDTGKIPTPIHERQRAKLVEEAADVIQKLDSLKANRRGEQGREGEIEAIIARLRQTAPPPAADTPVAAPPVAATPAAPPARAANGQTAFCTQCGAQVQRSDKFCASCGHALQAPAATGAAAGSQS